MIHALHAHQIDRYFAGTLRPAAAVRMFGRLWRCDACRVRYERHLLHERALPDGEARQQERLWQSILGSANADVAGGAAAATARPTAPGVVRGAFRLPALLGASALAGLLVLVAVRAHLEIPSAPVARGTAAEAVGAANVHFFRTVGDHQTEAVGETIHADDGILVAYSNPGSELSYLMVFAVDAHGAVYWYYPAYEQAGQDPAAPAIRTRALGVELGEEIRHQLPVGPLRMEALFLRRPLHVKEVEDLVAQAWRSHGGSVNALETLPLPVEDGQQLSRLLEVTP